MKKQGPPAPLDESKISMLKKRKAGEPDNTPKAVAVKKRRRSDADEETTAKKAAPKKSKANGIPNGSTKVEKKVSEKKKPVPMDSDSEDEEMVDDEFGDLDGVSDGSLDSDEGVERLSDLEDEDDEPEDDDSSLTPTRTITPVIPCSLTMKTFPTQKRS